MKHLRDLDDLDKPSFESYLESIKADSGVVPDKQDPRESDEYGQAFSVWKDDEGEEFEHNLHESGLTQSIDKMIKDGVMDVQTTISIANINGDRPAGIYWAFAEPDDDDKDNDMVVVYGKTSSENIDWETTFTLNASDEGDREIRMKSSGVVEIHSYKAEDGQVVEIDPIPVKC